MKKIIKEMDLKLDKLVHVKEIETINVNLNYFLKFKDYNDLLLNKSKKEIKYIKNPNFNIKAFKEINSPGLLKSFYPINYEKNYGTIDFNFKNNHNITKDFTAVKVLRLRLNDDIYRYYVESFDVDYVEFKNIYYGLIKYLCAEKNYINFDISDLNWIFIKSLELYCKNHSNELEDIIINGKNYITISAFLNDYKLCLLNQIINVVNSKYNPWQINNTYLDNRCIQKNKILSLKKQKKLN